MMPPEPASPAAPELSVIIVSYRTCALTLQAIAATLSQSGPRLEVIVVDNASGDGTAEAVAARFPQVRLLAQTENLGFARANNLAALQANGQFLLLLNPDTCATAGAFAALTDFAQRRPDAMIWGGRVLDPDGRVNPRSCSARPSLWSVLAQSAGLAALWPNSALLNPEAMPAWARDSERAVDIVTGCFLLIRRTDWMRLGGFDPAYFMYGEDVDLCLRAARLGARPAVTPLARIVHVEAASQPRNSREVQLLAGRVRYLRQHLPRWHGTLAIQAVRAGVILRLAGYQILSPLPFARPHLARMRHVWAERGQWWRGYRDLS